MKYLKSRSNFSVIGNVHTIKALFVSCCLMSSQVYADEAYDQGAALGNAIGSVLGALVHTVRSATNSSSSTQAQGSTSSYSANTTLSNADQQLMTNGMWRDPETGLIWMRCNVWQDKPWDGRSVDSQCASIHDVGDDEYMHQHYMKKSTDWAENMVAASQLHFGGYSDWRMPTTSELATLDRCKYLEDGSDSPVLRPVKVSLYTADSVRVSCDKPIYSGAEITIRPDVQKLGVTGGLSSNLSSRGKPIHTAYQTGFSDNPDDDGGVGFVVRGGQPDDVFSKNLIVAQKMIEDRNHKDGVTSAKNKADVERFEAQGRADQLKYNRELPAYLAAYKAKTAKFRQTVQAGDYAVDGLVIQVNGNAILVQTATGDKWESRNEILPRH